MIPFAQSPAACGYDETHQCLPYTGFPVFDVVVIGVFLLIAGLMVREVVGDTAKTKLTRAMRVTYAAVALILLAFVGLLITNDASAASRVSVATAKLFRADYKEGVQSHDPITSDYRNGRCHRVSVRHVDCSLWRYWSDQGSGVARRQEHVVHTRATRDGWAWTVTVHGPTCVEAC